MVSNSLAGVIVYSASFGILLPMIVTEPTLRGVRLRWRVLLCLLVVLAMSFVRQIEPDPLFGFHRLGGQSFTMNLEWAR